MAHKKRSEIRLGLDSKLLVVKQCGKIMAVTGGRVTTQDMGDLLIREGINMLELRRALGPEETRELLARLPASLEGKQPAIAVSSPASKAAPADPAKGKRGKVALQRDGKYFCPDCGKQLRGPQGMGPHQRHCNRA